MSNDVIQLTSKDVFIIRLQVLKVSFSLLQSSNLDWKNFGGWGGYFESPLASRLRVKHTWIIRTSNMTPIPASVPNPTKYHNRHEVTITSNGETRKNMAYAQAGTIGSRSLRPGSSRDQR